MERFSNYINRPVHFKSANIRYPELVTHGIVEPSKLTVSSKAENPQLPKTSIIISLSTAATKIVLYG